MAVDGWGDGAVGNGWDRAKWWAASQHHSTFPFEVQKKQNEQQYQYYFQNDGKTRTKQISKHRFMTCLAYPSLLLLSSHGGATAQLLALFMDTLPNRWIIERNGTALQNNTRPNRNYNLHYNQRRDVCFKIWLNALRNAVRSHGPLSLSVLSSMTVYRKRCG